jgi:superfamily II DNA helicase RecQ
MAIANAVQGWLALFAEVSDGTAPIYREDNAPIAVWVEHEGEVDGRILDPESGRLRSAESYSNFLGYQRTPSSGPAAHRYEKLRVWRYETATRAERPLYTVLGPEAMKNLADLQPTTAEELLAAGVLAIQIDRYGAELLALLAE